MASPRAAVGMELVGHRVAVRCLASRPELNGSRGLAASFDEAQGRVVVQLEGGTWGKRPDGAWAQSAGGGQISLKPHNLTVENSLVGLRVRIHGLEGRPELNNTFGWARSFDAGKGRYQVETQEGGGGAAIALRPDNLAKADGLSKGDWVNAFGD